jgi:hypothetical protein
MRINRPNPCQFGSIARRIVNVLLNSRKRSLAPTEIAFRAKIATQKVEQVVSALRNPFHNACIAKAGLAVERTADGGFCIKACRPKPDAHRPPAKRTQETAPESMETAA